MKTGRKYSWGNTFYNAMVEAAYMTHLERSKAVALACYAPMLCNTDYVNWKPDMLWFNNHAVLKTPNYHVQKMFMQAQGAEEVAFETEGLDELISFSDHDTLAGQIAVAGNDVEGRIWDLTVTDHDAGRVTEIPDFAIDLTNKEKVLADVDSRHYTVEFSFRRSMGRKGLKIVFGRTEESMVQWEFGGWDNWDCNIVSIVRKRSSVISHRIFHVEDREYRLKLEVTGRHIQTWINGEPWNDTVDRQPELEELYIAASVDSSCGKTWLKAVNLTGEDKTVRINLTGPAKNTVVITSLMADSLAAENTFERPDRVAPVAEEKEVEGNQLEYTFPAHSLTVLEYGQKG